MTLETFKATLDLSDRLEVLARPIYPLVLLSGGECSENPLLPDMISMAMSRGLKVVLITNGTWINDQAKREHILRKEFMVKDPLKRVEIQLTNVEGLYPQKVVVSPRLQRLLNVIPINKLMHLVPVGRWAGRENFGSLPLAKTPGSFNLRSMTRSFGDVRMALFHHRLRAIQAKGGHCSPNVDYQGNLRAGETNSCAIIGGVNSTAKEVTDNILNLGECNRCTLEKNLAPEHRRALGLT